jgi:formylglycine-generating enzyme required for sulfatase activity
VTEWQLNKQDEGTLLRGGLLVEAQRWISQKVHILTDEEKEYIRHSAEARERAVQEERQHAEQEMAQAKRLAEEAAKREEAERARAAAAEQASKSAEQAREAEANRAEAAERARRRQWSFSLALLILLVGAWVSTWLWQKGYSIEQATLKVKSLFVSIHVLPKMVQIPDGTFQQGDVEQLGVRPVTIKPFALGQFEVTFEEYDRFAIAEGKPLPGDQSWGRGRRPVVNISWQEAKDYADWLSRKTGKRYRLPTESEWEYTARSGVSQDVWAGTSEESQLGEYAVFINNSGNQTAIVGQKRHNAFGLHDMSGNVFEWIEDCVHVTYQGAPSDGSAWLEEQGGDCNLRIIRGGSWSSPSEFLRSSSRNRDVAADRINNVGFRLAQDID